MAGESSSCGVPANEDRPFGSAFAGVTHSLSAASVTRWPGADAIWYSAVVGTRWSFGAVVSRWPSVEVLFGVALCRGASLGCVAGRASAR